MIQTMYPIHLIAYRGVRAVSCAHTHTDVIVIVINEVILLNAHSSNIVLVVQDRLICITVLTSPHSSQLKLPLQVKLGIFSYNYTKHMSH